MPFESIFGVEIGRVTRVGIVQRSGKRVLTTGNCDQMHMIRHERVATNADRVFYASLPQHPNVDEEIAVFMEQRLFAYSTLVQMMGIARYDTPTKSWHGKPSGGFQRVGLV
jgi:hypothetical protein